MTGAGLFASGTFCAYFRKCRIYIFRKTVAIIKTGTGVKEGIAGWNLVFLFLCSKKTIVTGEGKWKKNDI